MKKKIYIHILFNIHIFWFRIFKAFSEGLEGPDGSPLLPIGIPVSDLDLWHPVHTRQLQPPPCSDLWEGMGAAVVLPLRVAVPIDGAFSHPAPTGCWLNSSASRLHVYAGCSLTVNETTEYFIKIHSSVQKTLKYLPVWITCHQPLNGAHINTWTSSWLPQEDHNTWGGENTIYWK